MSSQIPLSVWQWADHTGEDSGFILPGSDDLMAFSSLWNETDVLDETPEPATEAASLSAFHTPALLPDTLCDPVKLICKVPTSVNARCILLSVPPLLGKGTLSLNQKHLLSFCSVPGTHTDVQTSSGILFNLTDMLSPDQPNSLELHFEPLHPAGICDVFSLKLLTDARIHLVQTRRAITTFQYLFEISAFHPGNFCFQALALPSQHILFEQDLIFQNSGTQTISCTLPSADGNTGYCHFQLFQTGTSSTSVSYCDTLTLKTGKAPRPGNAILPIPPEDTVFYPSQFAEQIRRTGATAAYVTVPVSRACLDALTDAGIPLCFSKFMQQEMLPEWQIHPNVCFITPPAPISVGAASAWQLCGLLAHPRPVPYDLPAQVLLQEIFGTDDFSDIPRLPSRLAELHLLHVRLHAELVRQGTGTGALCASGEWDDPKIVEILSAVFQPCHLSLAPIQGAWFAGTELVFSSRIFWPDNPETLTDYQAELCLFDTNADLSVSDENVLYREMIPAASLLDRLHTEHVPLPEHSACLMLCGRLIGPNGTRDTVAVPVFVGERAVLEAVLTLPPPGERPDFNLFI